MEVLAPVDVEAHLAHLVRDAVLVLEAKHHDRAVHEVVHAVQQNRRVSLFVDPVKVNQLGGRNLDDVAALDEVDKSSFFQLMILGPFHSRCTIYFFDVLLLVK